MYQKSAHVVEPWIILWFMHECLCRKTLFFTQLSLQISHFLCNFNICACVLFHLCLNKMHKETIFVTQSQLDVYGLASGHINWHKKFATSWIYVLSVTQLRMSDYDVAMMENKNLISCTMYIYNISLSSQWYW